MAALKAVAGRLASAEYEHDQHCPCRYGYAIDDMSYELDKNYGFSPITAPGESRVKRPSSISTMRSAMSKIRLS